MAANKKIIVFFIADTNIYHQLYTGNLAQNIKYYLLISSNPKAPKNGRPHLTLNTALWTALRNAKVTNTRKNYTQKHI